VYVLNRENNCIARYSRYCTRFFRCPPYDSDELAHFLVRLAAEEALQGWLVFPSNDHAVATLSRNRNQLSKLYRLMVPAHEHLMEICDKLLLMRCASRADVPVPETWGISDVKPEEVSYPCLIKGRQGLSFYRATGKKAMVISNQSTLKKELQHTLLKANPDLAMIQQLIDPENLQSTVSVASFCVDGEVMAHWMGKKIREHPFRFGTATLTESIIEPEVLVHTQKIMKALQYSGIAEAEFLLNPDTGEYVLIEINPRTWLWVGHAAACGVDFTSMAWEHYVNGINHRPQQAGYIAGLKWRNFYPDLFYSFRAMAAGKLHPAQWIRQNRGKTVPAVWNPNDPLPFLMLTITLPLIALQR